MSTYSGSCHCGSVAFEADTDLGDPVRCNCSFCIRRGALLQKIPANLFRVTKGDASLTRYGSRDFSDHYFCSQCGIHTFTRSRRNSEDTVIVNIACLGGVDLDKIVPRLFDGATLL